MKSSWNNEYYDIMNFYYWEPQHLGKIKNPNSKIQSIHDALSHIAKMEVSLNPVSYTHLLRNFLGRTCDAFVMEDACWHVKHPASDKAIVS